MYVCMCVCMHACMPARVCVLLGLRVGRFSTTLAEYHPSRKNPPKPHMTEVGSIQTLPPGPQNAYQDPTSHAVWPRAARAPMGWQSCLGRFPSRPQNAQVGFLGSWYMSEML